MYLIYVPPYLLARWTSLPFTRARPSSQNPPPKYTEWCVSMEIGNRGREGEIESGPGRKKEDTCCVSLFLFGGDGEPTF